jgi:hypothetical protein
MDLLDARRDMMDAMQDLDELREENDRYKELLRQHHIVSRAPHAALDPVARASALLEKCNASPAARTIAAQIQGISAAGDQLVLEPADPLRLSSVVDALESAYESRHGTPPLLGPPPADRNLFVPLASEPQAIDDERAEEFNPAEGLEPDKATVDQGVEPAEDADVEEASAALQEEEAEEEELQEDLQEDLADEEQLQRRPTPPPGVDPDSFCEICEVYGHTAEECDDTVTF